MIGMESQPRQKQRQSVGMNGGSLHWSSIWTMPSIRCSVLGGSRSVRFRLQPPPQKQICTCGPRGFLGPSSSASLQKQQGTQEPVAFPWIAALPLFGCVGGSTTNSIKLKFGPVG